MRAEWKVERGEVDFVLGGGWRGAGKGSVSTQMMYSLLLYFVITARKLQWEGKRARTVEDVCDGRFAPYICAGGGFDSEFGGHFVGDKFVSNLCFYVFALISLSVQATLLYKKRKKVKRILHDEEQQFSISHEHSCHLEGRGKPTLWIAPGRAGGILCVGLRILALNDIGLALYVT